MWINCCEKLKKHIREFRRAACRGWRILIHGCEIMDVRNTPVSTDPDKLFYKLGLCGNPVEVDKTNKIPKFMKGPLRQSDNIFFGISTR